MTTSYLAYTLNDGYVDHWLIAGPLSRDLEEMPEDKTTLPAIHGLDASEIEAPIVHLDTFEMQGDTLKWSYAASAADHFLHLRAACRTPRYRQSWAYVELISSTTQTGGATLATHGPVDVWVDGDHVYESATFAAPTPAQHQFSLTLQEGVTALLIRFDQAVWGPTPYKIALRLAELSGVTLRLPSGTEASERFQALEAFFDLATVDRDLFLAYDSVAVRWPEALDRRRAELGIAAEDQLLVRLQKPDGRIYAETIGTPRAGEATETIRGHHLRSGPHQLVLMPTPEEYAVGRMRVRRVLEVDVLNTTPSERDNRDYIRRLYQGVHLAMQQEMGVLSELAAMALDAWRFVKAENLDAALASTELVPTERLRTLLTLLGMRYRYGDHDAFPDGMAEKIDDGVASALVDLPASEDEVGKLLALTLRLLAAQRTTPGPSEALESELTAWLRAGGQYGLRTLLDDGDALDTLIFALSHLADLAEATLVRELAAILLDKVLFTLAVNSCGGIGLGGALGTTAAVGRVVWGAGILNRRLWGVVGLANAQRYPIPPIVAEIANDVASPVLHQERHRRPGGDRLGDRITYRTADGMLTSVTRASEASPWLAALSATATVSVNHPAHMDCATGDELGFWHGDASHPRVAQWQDALVSLYALSETAWLDFTHAYFPIYAFDEHEIRDNWAFARKGGGYVAITASAPLKLMNEGPGAHRELRAEGRETVWLCQLGRAADDGDFAAFQEGVMATAINFGPRSVRWTTVRGEDLHFGWEMPVTVNGEPRRQPDARHYAGPYCTADFPAEEMDILYRNALLRLDFT